jgi:hypothetical protein
MKYSNKNKKDIKEGNQLSFTVIQREMIEKFVERGSWYERTKKNLL